MFIDLLMIFYFAESEELANEIVQIYSEISAKYLLRLNEGKLYKIQFRLY